MQLVVTFSLYVGQEIEIIEFSLLAGDRVEDGGEKGDQNSIGKFDNESQTLENPV